MTSQMTDQMGRTVTLTKVPRRVISLVPSITEYLIDLGVNVVGRTKFCVHPAEEVRAIPVIGGTKNFRMETIVRLNPDLIVGNKEENYKEGIDALEKRYPVWMSDVSTLADASEMMRQLGDVLDFANQANEWIIRTEQKLESLQSGRSGRVLYLIWYKPWMGVGPHTFIHSILTHLGYQNTVQQARYPELPEEEIVALHPDEILLSSEPYPFDENHRERLQLLCPNARISLVNGEAFSWYGSRIAKVW